ncbi:MAG TPA: MerR family transcriptional regulator [Nocardioidaceae bacterium]|nr:MerR family transcriptional regulator [Nocardioidaceae bacterium]
MTTEPLLTISAFARAVELAPSTLRYYDEAGLLPPAEVDPHTGYRYYTTDLARRAHLIRRMREVGVPVESMRAVLEGSADRAAEILAGFAEHAAVRARETSAVVDEVVSALRREEQPLAPATATLEGPELAAALRRVSHAAAAEDQPALCGVLLDLDGSALTVVASDRYRLASWEIPVAEAFAGPRRVFVPLPAGHGLAGWLTRQGTVTARLAAGDTQMTGDDGSRTVETADDRFPAYRLILDALPTPVGRATFSRGRVRRLLTDTHETDQAAVNLSVGGDRITISRVGDREGSHVDAVTTGDRFSVSFSPTLLRGALDSTVGADVTLSFAATARPVRITSVEQRRLSVLLMPIAER